MVQLGLRVNENLGKGCLEDSSDYRFHPTSGVTVYRTPFYTRSPVYIAKHSVKLKYVLGKVLVCICNLTGIKVEDVHIL